MKRKIYLYKKKFMSFLLMPVIRDFKEKQEPCPRRGYFLFEGDNERVMTQNIFR